MSTNQEYWDACMIRTWRQGGKTIDAMYMYKSITGKRTDESILLRVPVGHIPKECRAFVAQYLPKISAWLFKHNQDEDIKLLRKLSSSQYDCSNNSTFLPDPEKKALYQKQYKNKQIMQLARTMRANRNSDTDWNTVGGSFRRRPVR